MESNAIYKGIVYFLIIATIIFFIHSKNNDDGWQRVINVIEKDEYFGKVAFKFIDEENHNEPIIELVTKKKISLYGEHWDLVSVGDSVSKRLNETTIEVYKKDRILEIDQKKYIEFLSKRKQR